METFSLSMLQLEAVVRALEELTNEVDIVSSDQAAVLNEMKEILANGQAAMTAARASAAMAVQAASDNTGEDNGSKEEATESQVEDNQENMV